GYKDEALKELTPLDITPDGAQRETNRIFFQELQQGKRDHFEQIKQLQRKDGKLIWIQLYVFRIPNRGSVGPHTFGMNFDITEKMQAQDALRVAQEELARAAQASRIGAMAASIVHEINQPLTASRRAILEKFRDKHGHLPLASLPKEFVVALIDTMTPDEAKN